jgi:DNA-binding response OmpR family regulator
VAQGEGRVVLVVDDEHAIRMLCRINLELEGFRVLEAATADQAREVLDGNDVDIVLADVHIGGADGRELLRELRVAKRRRALALLTGSIDLGPEDRADVDAVILKPFAIDELIEVVRGLAGVLDSAP